MCVAICYYVRFERFECRETILRAKQAARCNRRGLWDSVGSELLGRRSDLREESELEARD